MAGKTWPMQQLSSGLSVATDRQGQWHAMLVSQPRQEEVQAHRQRVPPRFWVAVLSGNAPAKLIVVKQGVRAFNHQANRKTFSPLSALYTFSPTFPPSDPTQPLFTLKVGHHSAAPVVDVQRKGPL